MVVEMLLEDLWTCTASMLIAAVQLAWLSLLDGDFSIVIGGRGGLIIAPVLWRATRPELN